MYRDWFSKPMENEVPLEEIEKKSGEYHDWGFYPFEMQEMGYEGVLEKLKCYTAEKYEELDEAGKEKMVKEVLEIYRSVDLLPIQYYSDLGVMNEIEKCINYKAGFNGDTVSCVSGDTEYFNGTDWVRIDQYKSGDEVLQFNVNGSAELVSPLEYIHTVNSDPFYRVGGSNLDMVLTGNHDIVYVEGSEFRKSTVDELMKLRKFKEIPVSCVMKDSRDSIEADVNILSWIVNGILSDDESCSEYLIRVSGNLCFSDKVYRLSLESRRKLLSMLGVDRSYCIDMFNPVLARQVVELYSLSYYGNVRVTVDPADAVTGDLFVGMTGEEYSCDRVISTRSLNYYCENDTRFLESGCMLCSFDRAMVEKVDNGEGYSFSFKDKYCFVVPSHMLVLRRSGKVFVTGNCGAGVGTTLCNYLFPNLFDVPSKHDLDKKGAETLFKKFHNDEYLSRAIKFCFSYKNGCPTPTNVMGGLRLVGSAPTNFRPMNAKAVYERFCPDGGTVYDFCCVDDETEFFTGREWKRISEYSEGDRVLQYNEDGTAEVVDPIRYIHYESGDPFVEYNSGHLNTCLTFNHDVVFRMEDGSISKMKMLDVMEAEVINGYVPKNFKYVNRNSMPYIPDAKPIMDILTSILYISHEITCEKGSDGLYRFYYDDREVSFDIGRSNVEEDAKYRGLDIIYGSDGIRAYYGGKFLNDMFEIKDGYIVDVSDKFFDLDPRNMRDFLDVLCEDYADISHFDMTGYCLDRRDMPRFSEVVRFFAVACGMTCLPLEGTSLFSKFYDLMEAVTCDFDDDSESEVTESIVSACNGIKDIFKKWKTGRIGVHDEYFISPDDCLDGYDIILCSKVVYKKDKYCFEVPSHMLVLRRGGIVFVTGNCGFGGRMLGCLSSKKNFRYVGTDPCTETMYHLHELAGYIEDVTGRENSYELHCCGSEVFCGPDESVDFAFSSPPYFDLEVYSDEPTQCFNKFPTLEEWLEGYVRATIKNIYRMLKKGAVYAVNIADFTVGGSKEVAYVDEWIRISTEEGMPLYDTVYLGVTARAGSAQQAAGELKKENILIFKKPL